MKVYKAINAVQADLAKSGIGKDRENTFDRYKFRGIDDVYNALAPLLAKHGLCVLPRILARQVVERESQKGGALFYVTVEAEFDFVCAEDGSSHVVRTFGEAMDRGDKATNKAMSAAYKYAAFQAFAIPTEGDNDADAQTHEVKPAADLAKREEPAKVGFNRRLYEAAVAKFGEDFKLIREHLDDGDFDAAASIYYRIPEKAREAVWVAPTKLPDGLEPMLTTKHRDTMKTNPAWGEARGRFFSKPKEAA